MHAHLQVSYLTSAWFPQHLFLMKAVEKVFFFFFGVPAVVVVVVVVVMVLFLNIEADICFIMTI